MMDTRSGGRDAYADQRAHDVFWMTAQERNFEVGQRVVVMPDGPEVPARLRDCTPAWEAEIVGYWRNGQWIVRELVHNTTCARDAYRLVVA